jgi:hypothetical protein
MCALLVPVLFLVLSLRLLLVLILLLLFFLLACVRGLEEVQKGAVRSSRCQILIDGGIQNALRRKMV